MPILKKNREDYDFIHEIDGEKIYFFISENIAVSVKKINMEHRQHAIAVINEQICEWHSDKQMWHVLDDVYQDAYRSWLLEKEMLRK